MTDKTKKETITNAWAKKPKKPVKNIGNGMAEKARQNLKNRDKQLKDALKDTGV
jgi:hypothetical protein